MSLRLRRADLLRTFHKLALIYDLSGRAGTPSPAPSRQPQKGVDTDCLQFLRCPENALNNRGFMKQVGNGFYSLGLLAMVHKLFK